MANAITEDFSTILADPVFTPALKEQIKSVKEFQTKTEQFVDEVIKGTHPHAVLQGPPGLGKSYAVTQSLKRAGKKEGVDYMVVKGHVTPMSLFLTLYMFRRPGQVVVLDDCDDVLIKDAGLEVLKAVCDHECRIVKWISNNVPVINGTPLTEYVFNGTLIVCTNMAMTTGRGGRRDRAAGAFLSRLTNWPLKLESRERMFAQIFNMVVDVDYLSREVRTTLTLEQKRDMLAFILYHLDEIPSLDLRLPQKVAACIVADPADWRNTAKHIITHGGV